MASGSETTMAMCGNDLPIEVISYIMEHLNVADRICASQTCRSWYEANFHTLLHKNEVVFVYDNISRALKYLAPETQSSVSLIIPPFRNFAFRDVEVKFTGEMRHFWPKFGPQIKSLSLQCCEIGEKSLSDILRACPKLEVLHINGCKDLFMSGKVLESVVHHLRMPSLVEFGVMHTRYVSDSILNRFITIAPNLSRIILDGCYFSCNEAVYKRFYPQHKRVKIDAEIEAGTIPLDVASNVLTIQNIANILCVRAPHITALGLGHTSLNSSSLVDLCNVLKNSRLISLNMPVCFQLVNGLDRVAKCFSNNLQCLDLSSCCFMSANSLSHIPRLTHLTSLNLLHCQELSDAILRQFTSLTNLTSLNISRIEVLTGPAIVEGLSTMKKLQHVYLNQLPLLEGDSLLTLLRSLPPLLTLELHQCGLGVMDQAITILCEQHTTLRRLNLSRCQLLSDVGLTGMANLPNLDVPSELPFRNTSQENGISLACQAERQIVFEAKRKKTIEERMAPFKQHLLEIGNTEVLGIGKLKSLESLDLSDCPRVSDLSIRHAFKFIELKFLSLERNSIISDISMQQLGVFCPSLQELNLRDCKQLTDIGVTYLSHLNRLKTLNISGCDKLTNISLEALMNTKSPLKEVEMRQCQKFSLDAVNIFSNWLNHSITWSESIRDYPTWSPPPPPVFPYTVSMDC